jgi:hypothetical protein
MIVHSHIAPSLVRIPPAWKVHWDHLSQGRTVYPELRFESLLCLSLAPDFVLDFGWYLRDQDNGKEGIRFDLQINRGHFGLSDVVFYHGWFLLEPAIAGLQSWLDRLTANEATQMSDQDLQQRLAAIETRIRHFYVPPAGGHVEEPFSKYLRRLIKNEPVSYWLAGSGDAAIQYCNRHGVVQSQLIFLFREPHGFHLEWHRAESAALRLTSGRNTRAEDVVSIVLGGAPWDLPVNEFVSRTIAARVVSAFIEEGNGDCPGIGKWIS